MIDESPTGGTERGVTNAVARFSWLHCEGPLERGGGRYNCGDCGRSWGVLSTSNTSTKGGVTTQMPPTLEDTGDE